MNQIQDIVKTYYGETLSGSKDLKTDACTTADRPAPHVSAALAAVHDEVAARYYGCGLAIPPHHLDGKKYRRGLERHHLPRAAEEERRSEDPSIRSEQPQGHLRRCELYGRPSRGGGGIEGLRSPHDGSPRDHREDERWRKALDGTGPPRGRRRLLEGLVRRRVAVAGRLRARLPGNAESNSKI